MYCRPQMAACPTCSRPISHFEPSETKISEGLRPALPYSLAQMASLSSALPCSAPYLKSMALNFCSAHLMASLSGSLL